MSSKRSPPCEVFNKTEFITGKRYQGSHDHTGLGSPAVHHFLQGAWTLQCREPLHYRRAHWYLGKALYSVSLLAHVIYAYRFHKSQWCYFASLTDYYFISSVALFLYSSSHSAVYCTAWWCWRDHMTWYFRRGTALPLLSRIQWPFHSLVGQSSDVNIILHCNFKKSFPRDVSVLT